MRPIIIQNTHSLITSPHPFVLLSLLYPSLSDDGDPPLAKKQKASAESDNVFSFLMGDIVDIVDKSDDEDLEEAVNCEFQAYIHDPMMPGIIVSTYQYWSMNQHRFPYLAILAKKYLAVPGTSASSERVFSVAGLTITKNRSNLNPETVDAIIFLNKLL